MKKEVCPFCGKELELLNPIGLRGYSYCDNCTNIRAMVRFDIHVHQQLRCPFILNLMGIDHCSKRNTPNPSSSCYHKEYWRNCPLIERGLTIRESLSIL